MKWKSCRIGNVVKLEQGLCINAKSRHLLEDSGIPLLRITDMINKTTTQYINEKEISDKYVTKPVDLIYTRTGQVGLVFKGRVGVIHNNCFRIIPNEEIYPDYIYWYLKQKSIYDYANGIASGSAQPDLGHKSFRSITFHYPPLPTQQKIADILSAYDELIDNNNRRIELLEQAAQQLYKEWFVRFRFPGYEDAHFTKGIPDGWEVKRLYEFGQIETGKTPPTADAENYGGEIMFIKTPDMHGQAFVIDTEEKITEKGHLTQPKKLLPAKSISVSCIGTGGVVAINAGPAHTNQQINSIIPCDRNYLEWLYFACKELKPTIEMFGATGATMTNLSKGKFEKIKIICPAKTLIYDFSKITASMIDEIKTLQIKNQNLIKQRDLLLPRLMSGKIEV